MAILIGDASSPPAGAQPTSNRFLAAIKEDSWLKLRPHLRSLQLPAGRTLLHSGDGITTAYFPTTAVLSAMEVLNDGQAVEAATIGDETGCCLTEVRSRSAASALVVVQMAGHAFTLPASRLRACATADLSFTSLLDRHCQCALLKARRKVACVSFHSASARLAAWILDMSLRVQSSRVVITQEAVARCLGLQRTTVTAAAAQLQTTGAVRCRRGSIEILSSSILRGVACECAGRP